MTTRSLILPTLLLLLPPVVIAGDSALSFEMEETLMNPTHTSVTLSLVPEQDAELFVRFGTSRRDVAKTSVTGVSAGERITFELRELPPDSTVLAQVFARPLGQEHFEAREPVSFRTLRTSGQTVTFGILADSHAYAVWSKHACNVPPEQEGWGRLDQTYDNMAADASLDFIVVGGDDVMTHCAAGCVPCEVGGLPAGSGNVTSLDEARLRYRQVFSPALHGRLARATPLLTMLGNHDGEAGFTADVHHQCGHSTPIKNWSEQARLERLPNAAHTYAGGPLGNYYAFESGDALFVVLDPLRYNPSYPLSAEDWTLGQEQLDWLAGVLAGSDKPWKLLFCEHLVGGMAIPASCYWYGRGSLRCTLDGTPDAPFAGEQAIVHELMRTYGAQVMFLFHDHIVAIGEKPDEQGLGQGVWYVTAGQAGAKTPWWASDPFYSETMDFDLDGVPEYLTGSTGTTAKGYFRVSVGGERCRLVYVGTDPEHPELNGQPVLSWTLDR